jgi:aspartyl-tRNA(Asn)/glutamyl-tRNA(Gln) amidotransferase subunit B
MSTDTLQYRPLIGLEIHVQLATKTKMFCRCELAFGAAPNSRLCPVCLGLPGALPVINKQALDFAVQTALALNCEIATHTKWDRKSYYYPDLPKNYQISQYDLPIGSKGNFDITLESGKTKRIRITRVHLEEDAGKNIHDNPGYTQVDLNRGGAPLLEIVTEPDIASADEAYLFATELQRLVAYLGVSEASMQKGQMRFEPNINVIITHNGEEIPTPIVEVKNLNSFRSVRDAVDYEIKRQVTNWQTDHSYTLKNRGKENRGWSDNKGVTEYQRGKEEAHDYRYFPDPDLVPVESSAESIEAARAALPELPRDRQARFVKEWKLASDDADQIVSDRQTADLFETALAVGAKPATLSKQFTNIWAAKANEKSVTVAQLGLDAAALGELAMMVDDGDISASAASQIADAMMTGEKTPSVWADELQLRQVRDTNQTQAWVDQAFSDNEKAVRDALSNPKKAKAAPGFLRGQVMRISKGRADPKIVGQLIDEKLSLLSQ